MSWAVRGYHWAYFGLLVAALIVMRMLYWELWPQWVFRFNRPIEIVTVHPVTGEYLEYQMDYCKNMKFEDRIGTVEAYFEDHSLTILPDERSPIPAGCNVLRFGIMLPHLRPGIYYLHIRKQYFINPLKEEVDESRSAAVYIYANDGDRKSVV